MGAFYKTASPESVDFMFKLPQEQLISAMQFQEQNIDTQYQQAALFQDKLLTLKSLDPDSEEVKKYIKDMESQVNDLTMNLQNNPMNWKKQMPQIRDLATKIQKDFTSGAPAHWMSQYNSFQTADAAMKAKINKPESEGGITPLQYEKWKAYTLGQYKNSGGAAYNMETGTGNSIAIEELYPNIDINALVKKYTDDIVSNSEKRVTETVGGRYIQEYLVNGEYVTKERVMEIALNTLLADNRVMPFLDQGHRMGYMSGVYEDVNGKNQFINPLVKKEIIGKDGKPTGRYTYDINFNSALAPAIAGAVGRKAYSKTETSTKYREDEFAKIAATGEEARKTAKAQHELENPEVTPLTFEGTEKIMDPELFTPENLQAVVDKYKNKNPETTAEWTQYLNAKGALEALEAGAKKALKVSDAEFEEMKPFLTALAENPKSPSLADMKSGNYDKKLWGYTSGIIHPTPAYEAAQKKFKQLKASQKDLAKVIAETNTTKVPYFTIDEKSRSGKIIGNVAMQLAFNANDANIYNPKDNPEWEGLNISLKNRNKKFWNDEVAIDNPAQIAKYLIPKAETAVGNDYNVLYTIDYAKLAADGFDLLDNKTNNENSLGQVKIVYKNTNASKIKKETYKHVTDPDLLLSLDGRSDPQYMYVATQVAQQLTDYQNGRQIPKAFEIAPDHGAVITQNDGNKVKFSVFNNKTGMTNNYVINADMRPDGTIIPADSEVLTARLIQIAEQLKKDQLKLQFSKNTSYIGTLKK